MQEQQGSKQNDISLVHNVAEAVQVSRLHEAIILKFKRLLSQSINRNEHLFPEVLRLTAAGLAGGLENALLIHDQLITLLSPPQASITEVSEQLDDDFFVQKLLEEFYIGLARYCLATLVLEEFICFSFDVTTAEPLQGYLENYRAAKENLISQGGENFWANFIILAKSVHLIKNAFPKILTSQKVNPWHCMKDFYSDDRNSLALRLSTEIVGMHPASHPKLYGLAQTVHWLGFGGSGKLFSDVLKDEHRDALVGLCVQINETTRDVTGSQNENWQAFFKDPLAGLCQYHSQVLLEVAKQNTGREGAIKVHDVCSGVEFSAIQKLVESDLPLEVTVSDVGLQGLNVLCSKRKEVNLTDIRYLDLADLSNKAIYYAATDRGNTEKFDIISIRLGTHQLPNFDMAMAYLGRQLSVGGAIISSDVGRRNYCEVLFLPINIIDREGSIPHVFEFNLEMSSCANQSKQKVEFLFPLLRLAKRWESASFSVSIHDTFVYGKVETSEADYLKIVELWSGISALFQSMKSGEEPGIDSLVVPERITQLYSQCESILQSYQLPLLSINKPRQSSLEIIGQELTRRSETERLVSDSYSADGPSGSSSP